MSKIKTTSTFPHLTKLYLDAGINLPRQRWFRATMPTEGMNLELLQGVLRAGLDASGADPATVAGTVSQEEDAISSNSVICTFKWNRPSVPAGVAPSYARSGAVHVEILVRCFSEKACFLIHASQISKDTVTNTERNILMNRIGECFVGAKPITLL